MKDDKLLEMIRKSADSEEVPESLQPEAVKERLKNLQKEPSVSQLSDEKEGQETSGEWKEQQSERGEGTVNRPIRGFFRPWMRHGAVAAVLLLVFLGAIVGGRLEAGRLTKDTADEPLLAESVQAETAEEAEADTSQETVEEAEADTSQEAVEEAEAGSSQETGEGLKEYLTVAKDYDAIYQKLMEGYKNAADFSMDGGAEVAESAEEAAAGDIAVESVEDSASTSLLSGEYSQTNVQVKGVDEGDIVKTDGTYLYVLRKTEGVKIIRAEDLQLVSQVEWEEKGMRASEMYLDGDKLIVIGEFEAGQLFSESGTGEISRKQEDLAVLDVEESVGIYTYDITEREKPVLSGSTTQQGGYLTSRKNGSCLYVISRYYPNLEKNLTDPEGNPESFVPSVDGEVLAREDIYLPRDGADSQYSYLVITSVDTQKPSKTMDRCAVVTASDNFYVSKENIYITGARYGKNGQETTTLVRVSYDKGRVIPEAGGVLPGYLLDSFSMDEYQNHLRAVVSQWNNGSTATGLYVLDMDLKIVGKIADLAPGESLKSARFMGEKGYFVTFLEADPLFSVDLADPEHPVILGELKIPGFSSYLHFFGEDMLLGIGWEDSEDGWKRQVKLSMFDISQAADVKEIDKKILTDAVMCPGADEYKAVLVNEQDCLVGFAYGCIEENDWDKDSAYYGLFQYTKDKGFEQIFSCNLDKEEAFEGNMYYLNEIRGITIKDTLYIIMNRGVSAFDIKSQEKKLQMTW